MKQIMYVVYWVNWEGRDTEPEVIFNTLIEAYDYIEENSNNCAFDEGYIIYGKLENRWWYI